MSASQGKWKASHFTAKARVSQYISTELGPQANVIFPSCAFFYSNFVEWFKPQCGPLLHTAWQYPMGAKS